MGLEMAGETAVQEAEFAARTYLLLGRELFLSRKILKYMVLASCMIANVKIPLIWFLKFKVFCHLVIQYMNRMTFILLGSLKATQAHLFEGYHLFL